VDDKAINAYTLLLEKRLKNTLQLIPTARKLFFFNMFL